MVKTSALLLSLVCAVAVVQSATPEVSAATSPTVLKERRMLKGTGGRPSGGGRPSSGNRPSGGTSSTIIIVGGGGYYHPTSHGDSTANQNPSSAGATMGSQGVGSMVTDPDVYVAAPDMVLPSNGAVGNSATASILGAAALALIVANAL